MRYYVKNVQRNKQKTRLDLLSHTKKNNKKIFTLQLNINTFREQVASYNYITSAEMFDFIFLNEKHLY